MRDSLIILQCVIIICLIIMIYNAEKMEKMVTSPIDGRAYDVIDSMSNRDVAADKLAHINRYNQQFIAYLLKKPVNSMEYVLGSRLARNYDPGALFENDPIDKYNTSYTEDKGRTLALCLREKDTGNDNLHDMNLIMFVNLHELAHIASLDYGHGPEMDFWPNFRLLLHAAKEMGGYYPVDFEKNNDNYCGLDITYNPYFDNGLRKAEP